MVVCLMNHDCAHERSADEMNNKTAQIVGASFNFIIIRVAWTGRMKWKKKNLISIRAKMCHLVKYFIYAAARKKE